MPNIRKLCVLFFAIASLVCVSATAQSSGYSVDGLWLKKATDAYARTESKAGTLKDYAESSDFIHYVGAFLAVHRKNNILATVLVTGISNGRSFDKLPKHQQDQVRVAFAFAPLFALPDNLSMDQLVAILSRYLAQHPEDWNLPAVAILQSALAEAFPRIRQSQ